MIPPVPGTLALSPMTERRRLLGPAELAEQGPPGSSRPLPIDLVDENPENPRQQLAEVANLALSIRQFGLLQPVTVRRKGDRFELLGGHRRRAAFLMLAAEEPFEPKWKVIDAVVRTMDDDDTAYLALLAGQLQNRNWRPQEEAAALERLAESRSLREVGSLVHKSEPWVSHRLRVYNDDVLGAYVQKGLLSMYVADELRPIKDADLKRQMADQAIAEEWDGRKARAEVRKLTSAKQIAELGRRVQDLLDLLASVQPSEIDVATFRQLWTLHGRVQTLADQAREGTGPVFPSLERAAQVAGVNPNARPRKAQKKRRMMPRPS